MKLWHILALMAFGWGMMIYAAMGLIGLGMEQYGQNLHMDVCNGKMTKQEAANDIHKLPFSDSSLKGYKSVDCSDVRKLVDEL